MTRIRELIAAVREKYPQDRFFEDFEESCRIDKFKKRHYRTYDEALRLLDPQSWQVLKDKAVGHFLNHRNGQWKQGFFNQLNEAFAYRHLLRQNHRNVRILPEGHRPTPDIRYVAGREEKHCEVKTLGISDEEIQRRRLRDAYSGNVYAELSDGFLSKARSAFKAARAQIEAQGTDGLVYFIVLWDDIALDHYEEHRRQLVSYCRDHNMHDVYFKVGLRGNRRVRITRQ